VYETADCFGVFGIDLSHRGYKPSDIARFGRVVLTYWLQILPIEDATKLS
jgi:hypothetical protein